MSNVVSFKNAKEMFEHLQNSRKQADQRIQTWQKAIEPPAKVLRIHDMGGVPLLIYGELIDPVKAEEALYDLNDPIDAAEFDYTSKHYRGAWKDSYRFGRFYSTECPRGELGDIHLSTIVATITDEEFLFAKKAGWPTDLPSVYRAALRQKAS